MSDEGVKVSDTPSSAATKEPSMSAGEALAIAWTGIEELGRMKKVRLFHSPRTGRVWVEFSETEYTVANGLTVLAEGPKQADCEECGALATHFVRDFRRFPDEKLGIMKEEPIDQVRTYCSEHTRESITYELPAV